ncbi:hypothetical protein INR49_022921 [Caranx melampygus]|nr:hypothetical protein INR49_022921 [Caranx melampygus]
MEGREAPGSAWSLRDPAFGLERQRGAPGPVVLWSCGPESSLSTMSEETRPGTTLTTCLMMIHPETDEEEEAYWTRP